MNPAIVIGAGVAYLLLSGKNDPSGHPILRWSDIVRKHIDNSPLPPYWVLAMIAQESINGDPKSTGDNGASRGLMQVQQGALIDSGTGYEWDEMFDPDKNIETGIAYLKWIEIFLAARQGQVQHSMRDAILMSYNDGVGNYLAFNWEKGLAYVQSVKRRYEELVNA